MATNEKTFFIVGAMLTCFFLLVTLPVHGAFDDLVTYTWTEEQNDTTTTIIVDELAPELAPWLTTTTGSKLLAFYGQGGTFKISNSTNGYQWLNGTTIGLGDITGTLTNERDILLYVNGDLYKFGGTLANPNNSVIKSTDGGKGYTWTSLFGVLQPPFPLRNFVGGVIEYNNQMWIIDGRYGAGGSDFYGDVWSSSDGLSWTNHTTHTFNISETHPASFAYEYGGKIHQMRYSVLPGDTYLDMYDFSSSDGNTWTKTEISGIIYPWVYGKYYPYVYNGKVFITNHTYSGGNTLNQTYESSDGITWNSVGSNEGIRGLHAKSEYNGVLYMANPKGSGHMAQIWYTTSGYNWQILLQEISMSEGDRIWASSATFDNKTWIIGGNNGVSYLNDVWYSTNPTNWTNWVKVTSNAQFSPRMGHTSVVFDDKLWVIGGYNGSYLNDVWYTTNGTYWTQATDNAAFSGRWGHSSVVFEVETYSSSDEEEMWVIGGYNGTYYKGDVWHSSDGATWERSTNYAGFFGRVGHTSLVYKGEMWVIGGENSDTFFNDVWYSPNGVNWVEKTSSANFAPRSGHASAAFTNKIWVVEGRDEDEYMYDSWYSTDGEVWTHDTNLTYARAYGTSTIFENSFYILGGMVDEYLMAHLDAEAPNIIYGWVYDNGFNMLDSATVNIWNNTWSDSTTTPMDTEDGFYYFSDLAPAVFYSMNASKTGYITHPNTQVNSSVDGSMINKDFQLSGYYGLYVYLRDMYSRELITANNASVYVTQNSTHSYVGYGNTTNGSIHIPQLAGGEYYLVTGIADGYNYNRTALLLTNTTNLTLYLIPYGNNATLWSTAQTTSWVCVDQYGTPITGMNATLVGVETTLPIIDWALSLFGINLETTPITNTTMTGTTGSNGAIVFVIMPTEKYSIHFYDPGKSINETRYYYPSEAEYLEVFWIEVPVYSPELVSISIWNQTNTSDSTYMDIGAYYNDTGSDTDTFQFWVKNKDKEVIYTENHTSVSMLNITYPVLIEEGEIYYWGITANNTNYKNQFNVSHWVKFRESPLAIDLRIGYDAQAMEYYNWIAIISIIVPCAVLAYSRRTIKYACAMLGIMAVATKGIGWFAADWLIVSVVASIGFLLAFRFAEGEFW